MPSSGPHRHLNLIPERAPIQLTVALSWPWWLHPVVLVVGLTGSMAVVSILAPQSVYENWETVKYLDSDNSLWLLILLLAFLLGITAAAGRGFGSWASQLSLTPRSYAYIRRVYLGLSTLTILAYGIWSLWGVYNGVTLSSLTAVFQFDAGAVSSLKADIRPISGVTTMTQFGPVVVVLGVWLSRIEGRRVMLGMWLCIALAAVRSVLYAERLALLEVVIPLVVAGCVFQRVGGRRVSRPYVAAAPLLAVPALWVFFAVLEYGRSWPFYQHLTNQPYFLWITWRLLGYYVTAFDNSALLNDALPPYHVPPYFSFPVVWSTPGFQNVFPAPSVGIVPLDTWYGSLLRSHANVNLNNTGSFLVFRAEWGDLGSVLLWLAFGLCFGLLYTWARSGKPAALVLYLSVLIGLLELSRFTYWTQGRCAPILLACLVLLGARGRDRRSPGGSAARPAVPARRRRTPAVWGGE